MSFRTLDDLKKEEKKSKPDPRTANSYAGGQASGLAVSNPDEVEELVRKAHSDTQTHGTSRQHPNEIEMKITLYSNGFIVNDGPFRDYEKPENKQFIAELQQQRVPSELLSSTRGRPVSVSLEDKRSEAYVPPRYVAFSGEGMSVDRVSSQPIQPVNTSLSEPNVDPTQPTTNIQIRFHNGQRKSLTVNRTMRVSELYEYVMLAAPVDGSFSLVAGFPPKPVDNPSATISEAGLENSQVIQRIV